MAFLFHRWTTGQLQCAGRLPREHSLAGFLCYLSVALHTLSCRITPLNHDGCLFSHLLHFQVHKLDVSLSQWIEWKKWICCHIPIAKGDWPRQKTTHYQTRVYLHIFREKFKYLFYSNVRCIMLSYTMLFRLVLCRSRPWCFIWTLSRNSHCSTSHIITTFHIWQLYTTTSIVIWNTYRSGHQWR